MKKSALFLWILPLLLFVAACSAADDTFLSALNHKDDETETISGSEEVVTLVEGESLALDSFDATLLFVERKEDSRCPLNVTCVWEGRASVLLTFTPAGQEPISFELTGFVGPDGYEDANVPRVTHDAHGFRFTLERLDPYPDHSIEQTNTAAVTIRVAAL